MKAFLEALCLCCCCCWCSAGAANIPPAGGVHEEDGNFPCRNGGVKVLNEEFLSSAGERGELFHCECSRHFLGRFCQYARSRKVLEKQRSKLSVNALLCLLFMTSFCCCAWCFVFVRDRDCCAGRLESSPAGEREQDKWRRDRVAFLAAEHEPRDNRGETPPPRYEHVVFEAEETAELLTAASLRTRYEPIL